MCSPLEICPGSPQGRHCSLGSSAMTDMACDMRPAGTGDTAAPKGWESLGSICKLRIKPPGKASGTKLLALASSGLHPSVFPQAEGASWDRRPPNYRHWGTTYEGWQGLTCKFPQLRLATAPRIYSEYQENTNCRNLFILKVYHLRSLVL